MTKKFTLALLSLTLMVAAVSARAETPEDKAYMLEFVELNKRALRLSREGDDDNIEKFIPSLRQLAKRANISPPCTEAVKAKIAMLEANVLFLRADDGKDMPFLLEIQKQERLLNERRGVCLGGRQNP
ncbi:hypothetical protein [Ottowia thiooxydans]|uniref:hypothetical protein n=1 Tax=Ottowia thiooxydans TaxID=219182 RepID=UPI00048C5BA4|nr:hypothetical protein [Ottowia thiooxydans]